MPANAGPLVDKQFELSSSMLRKYMTTYQQSYFEEQRLQLLHRRAINSTAPFFPPRRNPANVAILTPHEGTANWATRMGHYTKEQYARLHSYPFLLDQNSYAANHTRHATWNRYVCPHTLVRQSLVCPAARLLCLTSHLSDCPRCG